MDEILLLLMHTQNGLKLEAREVVDVLSQDPGRPADALCSDEARAYLRENPDWRTQSLAVLAESESHGIRWSRLGLPDYPGGWLTLSQRPCVFSYLGEPCWRTTPMLAVVGSRTPMSDSLLWMQRELSPFLRRSGVAVVSGAARGVDHWAHRLSLDEDRPTICVLPSGILSPYPLGNQEIWERVVSGGGCLLSTFPLKGEMRKHHFHVRNRWIVGLSPAVLVVEANRRSGSAMTAALAKDEGREVATLPVFPHSDQGLGNLDLLACGATMIRDQGDLAQMWERCRLSPTLFQGLHGEGEEQGIHHP